MTYHIASVSWGKDSLAMLIRLIDERKPLDEVVFFDTGLEFEAIYKIRDEYRELLQACGIKYTELRPKDPMWWTMFCRPVNEKKSQKKPNPINIAFKRAGMLPDGIHYGYGWCGGSCRWGTSEKIRTLDRYAKSKGAMVYVGLAADEQHRIEKEHKPYKLYPLSDWGMTEQDCLAYCREHGESWDQEGIDLYDILDRVSCWCCRNKNQTELKAIHDHLPDTWRRLCALEDVLGQMKTKPLEEIGD